MRKKHERETMIDMKQKQSGSTLVGVIIGLVIGLGAALVVAVMISKSPVPFLSKSIQSEKLAALLPGQLTDPNKPLYGNKAAAKEAARDFVKEPAETAEMVSVPKSAPIVTPPPAVVKPAPPAAPAAVVASAAPTATAATTAPVAEDKWIYYLQAGAFRDVADAEGARAKLALQGVQAGLSERQSDNGTLYRVRVGPFNQLDAMNKVRSKLSESGIEVVVVRTAK
jgi:cell division protein FtsN